VLHGEIHESLVVDDLEMVPSRSSHRLRVGVETRRKGGPPPSRLWTVPSGSSVPISPGKSRSMASSVSRAIERTTLSAWIELATWWMK
jgi:hypothetical protein